MKIAILADALDNQWAGIHVYTHGMIHALPKYAPEHKYFIIRETEGEQLKGIEQIVVGKRIKMIKKNPARWWHTIPAILKKLNVDVVTEPAHFGPVNLPPEILRVTLIHDLTPIKFPRFHPRGSSFLQKRFLPGILGKTGLIITNSDHTTTDLNTLYPFTKEKTIRIYPGCRESFAKEEIPSVLLKYGLNKPYFLYAGTIEPRKNLTLLLDAWAVFCQKSSKQHQLVIAGKSGWKNKAFFSKLEKHPFIDSITLTGYISDLELKAMYSSATAFVYPSLYEGFGFPVCEAMSCGTPCLVSNSSSMPEVAGMAAVYFNPEDRMELAVRMMQLSQDVELRKSLSEKSIVQAGKFSWESFVNQFISALENFRS